MMFKFLKKIIFLSFFVVLSFPSLVSAVDGWTEQRGSDIQSWVDMAVSDSGQYVTGVTYKKIMVSSDYGVTWNTPVYDEARQFYGVTVSGTGQYMAVSDYGGKIWTSSDYGVTWQNLVNTANSVNRSWYNIDSSADGRYLVAGVDNANIWTSSDYGVTWSNTNNAGLRRWKAVTISDDGRYLAAVARNANAWVSSDYGVTWQEKAISISSLRYLFAISSNSTGQKIAIVNGSSGEYIHTSDDYGQTWTRRINDVYGWYDVTYNDAGDKLIASNARNVYESTDNGETWSTISGLPYLSKRWYSAVYDSTGNKIFLNASASYVYTYNQVASSPLVAKNYPSADSNSTTINFSASAYNDSQKLNYGLTTSYGNSKTNTNPLNLETASLLLDNSSVNPNTVYNYQLTLGNEFGENYSENKNFIIHPFVQKNYEATKVWQAITSSDDASLLVAVVNGGYIYTSTDYGETWVQKTSDAARAWQAITSSDDASLLVAVVNGGYIYTSTDYGETWVQKTSDAARAWKQVSSSADGRYLAAITTGGYIYVSSDYGETWIQKTSDLARNWKSISVSPSGEKMIAALDSGATFFTSTNFGADWNSHTGGGIISTLTMNFLKIISADGQKVVLGDDNGNIWLSNDGGVNWSVTAVDFGSLKWTALASSNNGSKLFALNDGGYIYSSIDGGLNWTEQRSATSQSWRGITTSSDGSKVIAVSASGYTYNYLADSPAIILLTPSSVTHEEITLNASITNTGGDDVTERGFEYGLDSSYGESFVQNGNFGITNFSLNLKFLKCGTTYHYRAFATNSSGKTYTSDETVKTVDCNFLPFVLPAGIGSGAYDFTVEMYKTADVGAINEQGVNLLVYLGSVIDFKLLKSDWSGNFLDHQLKITDLDLAVNKITLEFKGKKIILNLGQEIKLDSDNDGLNDLGLEFVNVYVNRAELTAKLLKNEKNVSVIKDSNPVVVPVEKEKIEKSGELKKNIFTKDLKIGMTDNQVKELQKFLNNQNYLVSPSGAGSLGKETNYFGLATKAALTKFQKDHKISPSVGYFGPVTRKIVNSK